jgi:hypothetical protein
MRPPACQKRSITGIYIEISSAIFDISMINDSLPEGIRQESRHFEIIHAGEFSLAGMGAGYEGAIWI